MRGPAPEAEPMPISSSSTRSASPTRPRSPAISRRRWLAMACVLATTVAARSQARDYPEISWDDLIPEGWDPLSSFDDVQHLAALPDTDERVQQVYERMRKIWDEAPTVDTMAGRAIRLPGYLVPLDTSRNGLREFLLVPYFGACIHTPPPPANQIIHVQTDKPLKGFATMDAIWVDGELSLVRHRSAMGASGYRLKAARITRYTEPKER